MALPKLEGIVTISSGSSVSITETGGGGTASVSLTAGDYSLSELCAHLAVVLTSNGTLSGTYSCSVADGSDTSSGKVTISASGITSFTLTWTDSTVRDAFGFTATLAPTAATFTADDASPWIWLPNVGRSDADLADGDEGDPIRQVAVNCAPSGDVYAWASSALRYETVIEFQNVKGYKGLRSLEVVTNESLQTFFETVISKGIPFRYYADRSDDTTYTEHVAKQGDAERFGLEPQIKGWRGAQSLWTYRVDTYTTGASSEDWTPAELSPLAWYRSDSVVGSPVSTWTDLSGNGYHATGSGSARPTISAGALNGCDALVFSDAVPSLLSVSIPIPTNGSVIIVGNLTSGKTSYRSLIRATATSAPAIYVQDNTSAGHAIYWTSGFLIVGSTAVNDGVNRALRWMWGTSNVSLAVNDGADSTATRAASVVAGSFQNIGSSSGVHAFDGHLFEIIVVADELTADQKTALNVYLSDRYGLW